jgi:hypothetical protein
MLSGGVVLMDNNNHTAIKQPMKHGDWWINGLLNNVQTGRRCTTFLPERHADLVLVTRNPACTVQYLEAGIFKELFGL